MTAKEFNEKYEAYLEDGHYGCGIDLEEVVDYLDKEFEELIKLPGFQYAQIKLKFGMGRFYCDGVSQEKIYDIERSITELCQ